MTIRPMGIVMNLLDSALSQPKLVKTVIKLRLAACQREVVVTISERERTREGDEMGEACHVSGRVGQVFFQPPHHVADGL